MNNSRRKRIQKVIDQLVKLRIETEAVKDAEEEAFDSLPESLDESIQSDQIRASIEELEEADADFENLIEGLNNAIQ